jgi:hypothetical protein
MVTFERAPGYRCQPFVGLAVGEVLLDRELVDTIGVGGCPAHLEDEPDEPDRKGGDHDDGEGRHSGRHSEWAEAVPARRDVAGVRTTIATFALVALVEDARRGSDDVEGIPGGATGVRPARPSRREHRMWGMTACPNGSGGRNLVVRVRRRHQAASGMISAGEISMPWRSAAARTAAIDPAGMRFVVRQYWMTEGGRPIFSAASRTLPNRASTDAICVMA